MSALHPSLSLPRRLRAGDVLTSTVQMPGGAVSAFLVLTGVINNAPTRITIGGTGVAVDGTGAVTFSKASADTAAWQPGRYQWVLFGLDGDGNRTQVAQGTVNILPDPAGENVADPRSYNERMLDQIRALQQGKALDDVAMYKIGGRELTKIPIADLTKWEADYERRVRNERIRRGERVPTKTIGITFGGR